MAKAKTKTKTSLSSSRKGGASRKRMATLTQETGKRRVADQHGAEESVEPANPGAAQQHPPAPTCGQEDERESLVNERQRGTKYEITPKVEEVTSIHGFMNDLDCKCFDPEVVGEECVRTPAAFYDQHVRHWLDRDVVLAKAEVRDSGGGLHTILWLDEPIIVAAGEATMWDDVARGICNALPGDPNLNGIIALTRPVGAVNTKYEPPREIHRLRPGEPVTRAEILDLSGRVSGQPARLWMRIFFGGERVDPCPLCGKASLGLAGYWQCRCYECGRVDAASLVYRFYSPEFLKKFREGAHG